METVVSQHVRRIGHHLDFSKILCVCEVCTVGKISDYQPEGPRFNPRPGRWLNFGRPSFATLSVDRDVKLLGLNVLSRDLKEPTHLSIGVG